MRARTRGKRSDPEKTVPLSGLICVDCGKRGVCGPPSEGSGEKRWKEMTKYEKGSNSVKKSTRPKKGLVQKNKTVQTALGHGKRAVESSPSPFEVILF